MKLYQNKVCTSKKYLCLFCIKMLLVYDIIQEYKSVIEEQAADYDKEQEQFHADNQMLLQKIQVCLSCELCYKTCKLRKVAIIF